MFDSPSPTELVCVEANLINLCGEIEEQLAQMIVRGLYQLAAKAPERPITLLITSGGGSVYEANAIADAIRHVRTQGTEVTARVHGYAMSSAVFPLLVSTKRIAMIDSALMIHGMTAGSSGDMKALRAEQAHNEWLLEQQATLLGTYTKRTRDEWLPILNESLPQYYSAAEALELGLVDAIES